MEIGLRALVVFVFLWVVTRSVGRSTLGELSTFELILYVAMGDLVQQGVTQQDYSLTSAFLAVGVFALLTIALSYVSWKWPRTRPLIRGNPVLILRGGEPLMDVLKRQRLAIDVRQIEPLARGEQRLQEQGAVALTGRDLARQWTLDRVAATRLDEMHDMAVGKPAPETALVDLQGKKVKLSMSN